MLTFAINNNNDLYIDTNNNIALKTDLAAMGDIFVNKAQTNKGELVYNAEKGIDYFNTIFGEPCYPDLFQNDLINELENTAETQKISGYTQEIKDGVYSYTVNCQTSFGEISLNG